MKIKNKITQIKKRDDRIVDFDKSKITDAIFKALTATDKGGRGVARRLTNKVVDFLNKRFKENEIPTVEDIQDIVEEVLILEDLTETAKAYILYREQRRRIRESQKTIEETLKTIDNYIGEQDWQIKENANMAFSLQGLNHYLTSAGTKKYWLNKVYPEEIRKSALDGDFHLHNLDTLATYCCGWDLYDLLLKGFGGVSTKLVSKPPKHFRTALGQLVNFFFTVQGECYSADTQVLTESGWKYFYEVEKDEKAFTLNNDTNKIELRKPIRFHEYPYNGQLYNFKSKKLDLLVTPNHNMVVDQYCPNCKGGPYRRKIVRAKDLKPSEHFIPKTSIWEGKKEEWFELPEVKILQYRHLNTSLGPANRQHVSAVAKIQKEDQMLWGSKTTALSSPPRWKYEIKTLPAKKIPMNDWLAFFGFWLAEGSTYLRKRIDRGRKRPYYEYTVRISQNEGNTAKNFEKILKQLPFNYNKKIQGDKIDFVICDKQLFSYLKQFGKGGDKFIPEKIKSLPSNQLKRLFDWMMLGDGYVGNGNVEYYSKSLRLANDAQEIVLKLGQSANIRKKRKGKFEWYVVGISRAKRFKFTSKKQNIKKVKYRGKVYCLEMPNHTLYVRRNGKACWCGNSAGAQAISSFDTLLAPFIRYDNLNQQQVKQAMQEFIFNCAVPTRTGFQTPFLNVTLDINPSPTLAKQPVIISGKAKDETYGEFQEEMNVFNQVFAEVMGEGDANGRVFTFPIPTINITKDFDWDNPALENIWEMTAKYGIPYFANFIQSDMKPEDVRSMCCRLRLSNKELYIRGGGLFGSNPLTGSIGVVTINLPRIGYVSKNKKQFLEQLGHIMDLAKESLEIKRKALDDFTEKGLYPYAKHYLSGIKKIRGSYWGNHFSTIGLVGMNEALLNLMKKDIGSDKGRKFTLEILDFMRDRIVKYQEETGNLYNLEATPAESAAYRLARLDKKKHPDIITAGEKEPYYTNSTNLPVNYTDDLFEAIKLQDDTLAKYTGGCVLHGFIGEKIPNGETVKLLVKKVFENFKLPYFTLTPTFSICPHHGYIAGEHFTCPKCIIEQPCEVYSRIVGYLRPVSQWNEGKQEEFGDRKAFKI